MKKDVYGGRMSRVKAGTAALLAAAIFWGGIRAASEVPRLGEKLLVASAALTLPQGAAAVLKHRFGEAEQAPPTEESTSAADTESSQNEYAFERE